MCFFSRNDGFRGPSKVYSESSNISPGGGILWYIHLHVSLRLVSLGFSSHNMPVSWILWVPKTTKGHTEPLRERPPPKKIER